MRLSLCLRQRSRQNFVQFHRVGVLCGSAQLQFFLKDIDEYYEATLTGGLKKLKWTVFEKWNESSSSLTVFRVFSKQRKL
jgi:hypothetical protein